MARPLGLDLWIGLPETEEHRVADQFSSLPEATPQQTRDQLQALGVDLNSPIVQTMLASSSLGGEEAISTLNSREGHAAEVPSANGIGNARSLAKLYAALVGVVDGARLLQPDTVDRVRVAQTDGMTAPGPLAAIPQPYPLRFALGYEAGALHRLSLARRLVFRPRRLGRPVGLRRPGHRGRCRLHLHQQPLGLRRGAGRPLAAMDRGAARGATGGEFRGVHITSKTRFHAFACLIPARAHFPPN